MILEAAGELDVFRLEIPCGWTTIHFFHHVEYLSLCLDGSQLEFEGIHRHLRCVVSCVYIIIYIRILI